MQVENLIGDRRSRVDEDRDHRCVSPLRFVFLDLVHRDLSALTGNSRYSAQRNIAADIWGKADFANGGQAFDVCEHGLRAGLAR